MAYMTAVIYARYSSNSQREESIEGQIRECRAFAEKNGYTIIHNYMDRAISGKTDDRPQFQKMIADSKKKLFADVETDTEESGSDTDCPPAPRNPDPIGVWVSCVQPESNPFQCNTPVGCCSRGLDRATQ